MATADQVIALGRREVGYVEQGGKDGRSGNLTKYGAWFGWNGVAWCAIFLSYLFDEAGQPWRGVQTAKGFASCQLGVDWAKKRGLWVARGRGPFLAGDVVMYDEGALEGHAPSGHAGHTGLLIEPRRAEVSTIEGNTSPTSRGSQRNGGQVAEKVRPLSLVLGVIRPPFDVGAPPASKPPARAWPGRTLMLTSPAMRGADVTAVQKQLIKFGGHLTADGEFGKVTHDHVVWFQHAFGLDDDGIVGRVTWDEFFRR